MPTETVRDVRLHTLILLAILAAVAAAVSARTSVPFWVAFAIALAATFANGLLLTLEDDLPGGFNNPDGTSTPRYVATVARVVRWSGANLCLAVAVGATLIAFQRQILADQLIGIGVAVLFVSAGLVMIRERRWALIVGGLSAIVFVVAATQR
jgi:hypothetical protein